MIHSKLFRAHLFILPISRDKEQKKKSPDSSLWAQIGLISFVGMETATQITQAHSYLRSSCRIAGASVKKKTQKHESNFLYKAVQKWNPSQNASWPACKGIISMISERIWRTNWKKKYVQGLLHWHSKQLPEWFLIKHFPYQRMHVPVPAQSEERNSQQEKMLRAQEGDLPSAPQKQDAIILLLLMSTVKAKLILQTKPGF